VGGSNSEANNAPIQLMFWLFGRCIDESVLVKHAPHLNVLATVVPEWLSEIPQIGSYMLQPKSVSIPRAEAESQQWLLQLERMDTTY